MAGGSMGILVVKHIEYINAIVMIGSNNQEIDSDELQGVIRNPFAFYFTIQWGFSGPIQTLPLDYIQSDGGPCDWPKEKQLKNTGIIYQKGQTGHSIQSISESK